MDNLLCHCAILTTKQYLVSKQCSDGMIFYISRAMVTTTTATTLEPTCFIVANKDHAWRHTMSEEFDALLYNNTWSLVTATSNLNIIGDEWVFWLKYNIDGTFQWHKAWMVAKDINKLTLTMVKHTVPLLNSIWFGLFFDCCNSRLVYSSVRRTKYILTWRPL